MRATLGKSIRLFLTSGFMSLTKVVPEDRVQFKIQCIFVFNLHRCRPNLLYIFFKKKKSKNTLGVATQKSTLSFYTET